MKKNKIIMEISKEKHGQIEENETKWQYGKDCAVKIQHTVQNYHILHMKYLQLFVYQQYLNKAVKINT